MDIVERSSLTLFSRLAPGDTPSTSPLVTLTPYAWPSYRRITLAEGGDAGASFNITGDVADEASMEYWLENWLAAHFVEEYGGETCFVGRIHTMRLTYNGIFLVYSLDSCWNKIACRYTSVVDGQQYLSSFEEDSDSQAVWGVRELILEPEDIIGGAEATALAQDALAELAQPRVWRGDVDFAATAKPVLKVEVEGYPATLDVKHHNDTSTATQDAD
ncbi:MAG: hypothetical protein KC415_19855, partial [Anaerolineales bacterium]|nr:hypothetical protein [Anaerolineales bacterium]